MAKKKSVQTGKPKLTKLELSQQAHARMESFNRRKSYKNTACGDYHAEVRKEQSRTHSIMPPSERKKVFDNQMRRYGIKKE